MSKWNIGKWNYDTHEYDPYDLPDGKTIILYTPNMEMQISCTGCFNDMVYGDSFTSRVLHNHFGLGYPVCDDCYQKEVLAEKAAKDENN